MIKLIQTSIPFVISTFLILSCGGDKNSDVQVDETPEKVKTEEQAKEEEESQDQIINSIPSALPRKGMTVSELKAIYKDATFISQKAHKYGYDGGYPGYDIIQNDEYLFHISKDFSSDTILFTILLSPRYKYNGIHVGMTATQLLRKYQKAEPFINVYNGLETISLDSGAVIATFNTTDKARMANYDFSEGEGIFTEFINTDFPILTLAIPE